MKRSLALILLVTGWSVAGHAQSIGPKAIKAAGGSGTTGGYTFDWSVGEMALVSTFSAGSVVVTQGVLQPSEIPTGIGTTTLLKQLLVFPNPASSVVNLQYNSGDRGTLTCRLMDMSGQLLSSNTTAIAPGQNTTQVDVSSLACATYLLEVTLTANDISEKTAYKIQKLK